MIIFEAQYSDIYDVEFIRTIEVDSTSFDYEHDVWMLASERALRMLEPDETILAVRYLGEF